MHYCSAVVNERRRRGKGWAFTPHPEMACVQPNVAPHTKSPRILSSLSGARLAVPLMFVMSTLKLSPLVTRFKRQVGRVEDSQWSELLDDEVNSRRCVL